MTTLKIDRSKPLDLQSDLLGLGRFSREEINPKSELVLEIDPSKLKLACVLGSEIVDPKLVSRTIRKNLEDISANGLTLLDAKVLEALLANQQMIPKEWCPIADTDSFRPETATICFYGSILKGKPSFSEDHVLALSFARGYWSRSFSPASFTKAELESFTHNGKFAYSKILAAVI